MGEENNISESILESFEASDVYQKICGTLPPRNISFSDLSLDEAIGCEMICAAICHQINWDFLRNSVYEATRANAKWISPEELSRISVEKVRKLLDGYSKPERIREKERCGLLRSLGKRLLELNYRYLDIFFDSNLVVKSKNEIFSLVNSIRVFSSDPEGKKLQLLLQNLSDYEPLSVLSEYCKPAVDYHIIREFLRRGLVTPTNQKARDYILNPNVERKEKTIAGLRKVCSEVFYTLQWITSCNIITLNSVEWWLGRSVCLKDMPDCQLENSASQWLKPIFSKCPFYDSCKAVQVDHSLLKVVEPNYQGSSY